MCFKKIIAWFYKPPPEPPIQAKRRALLFAINDYPGSGNDLNGCLNDMKDIATKLLDLWPDFDIKTFPNSSVTKARFISEINNAVSPMETGDILVIAYSGHGTQVYDQNSDESDGYDEALYLYDGVLIDDDINKSLQNIPDGAKVIILLDSCFSGTATRKANQQNRFYQLPDKPMRKNINHKIIRNYGMKWIVISGCGEHQTCADAYFNGRPNGAFTYYLLKALQPGMTYTEWFNKLRVYLPNDNFDQAPEIEGNETLFSNIVLI